MSSASFHLVHLLAKAAITASRAGVGAIEIAVLAIHIVSLKPSVEGLVDIVQVLR